MKTRTFLISMSMLVAPLALASALLPGDADHGRQVHDKSCAGCHDSMTGGNGNQLYTRDNRRVGSIEGLMAQVGRCNSMQRLGLDEKDIDGVVKYLNEEFYKFGD